MNLTWKHLKIGDYTHTRTATSSRGLRRGCLPDILAVPLLSGNFPCVGLWANCGHHRGLVFWHRPAPASQSHPIPPSKLQSNRSSHLPKPPSWPPIQANDNVSTFLTKQKKEGTTFQSCSDESVAAVGKWKLLNVWVLSELGESDRSEQWVRKLEDVIDDP